MAVRISRRPEERAKNRKTEDQILRDPERFFLEERQRIRAEIEREASEPRSD